MTLEVLEARVAQAALKAAAKADKCRDLLDKGSLAAAIEYCKSTGIDPPQCSLTAQSENAQRLRLGAERKLSDPMWWGKVLETEAIQNYEGEQMAKGNVRNYVSDGLATYMQKQKARK